MSFCRVVTKIATPNFGVVLKYSKGMFIVAIQGSFLGLHFPQMAEAMGLCEALSWLKQMNIKKVKVESDSQIVINALNSDMLDSSCFRLVISDCKSFVKALINVALFFLIDQRIRWLIVLQGQHVLSLVKRFG